MKKGHINDWAPEVRSLLQRLMAAGATIVSGDNGEDKFKFPNKDTSGNYPAEVEQFIENLIACDEAYLYVNTPDCPRGCNRWIFLVLGNCPGEIASDYIVDPLIDKATSEHYDEWQGKEQPTKPSPYGSPSIGREDYPVKAATETLVKVECPTLKLSGNMVVLDMVVLDVVNGEVEGPETGAA